MSALVYRYRDAVAEYKRLMELREQALLPPHWSPVNLERDPWSLSEEHLRDLLQQLESDIWESRQGYNAAMEARDKNGTPKGNPTGDSGQSFSLLAFGAAAIGLVVLTKMRMF